MRVVIVARTRRGAGACVGGIAQDGRSVRLVAVDADRNAHAGLEYQIGEVWEIESTPDPNITPPHVENVIVRAARRLKRVENLEPIIRRFMPPVSGGPTRLFDGKLQHLSSGALFICERTGLPSRSTMFWVSDQPLRRDVEAKRIRYCYPTPDGGRLLTFVGFQEPPEDIPAGTLLRVSLAHWWRPKDKPEEELRCHVQLSGWFVSKPSSSGLSSFPSLVPGGQESNAAELGDPTSPVPDLARARQVLKQTFGYADFLPLQADVIRRVLERRDTLVIMPTGGGKSLCYQLPALLHEGLTLVVSPLIALMQDQVSQLRELGVSAGFLNSTLSHQDYVAMTNRVRRGEIRILYVAPETLLRPETLLLMEQNRLACLAVDEAHCISEWGHDFRPEYRKIQEVRRRFPQAGCLALTATATRRVREDIRRLLGITRDGEFVASFNRANLFLAAQPRRDGLGQTLAYLDQHKARSGIIYCSTKKQVDALAAELRARGWPALPYHAGMEAEVRRRNQNTFIRDDATIMVATIAFGMGINKSNVRFVLHYNLPRDLESYYQEVGRAGRDGLPADCLLLHSHADAVTIRRFIDEGAESERPGRQARLDAMMRFAETTDCRRGPLLAYFGETHTHNCGGCDNCRAGERPVERRDVTEAAQKFLSCVRRTGEMFGAAHVIDVLRGSRSQRVLARGHDRLSTYGIGTEFSKEEWSELARQFIEQGLVEQDLQFGGLRLTNKSRPVLKGEKVFVRCEPRAAVAPGVGAAPGEHDAELFERLRQLRRDLADRAGVPAYIIFSDRALVEMATRFPQTAGQFLAINGVGEAKRANYGEAFMKVIRDHCATRAGPPAPTAPEAGPEPTSWLTAHRRFEEIGEAFSAGATVDELASRFRIKPSTVIQNLTRYVESGGQLDADRLLSGSRLTTAQRERVFTEFKRHGLERLAPVRDALGGTVSYEELHLLRLCLKCRHRSG
jgi:ATP-dependent DNA helicase RecQ